MSRLRAAFLLGVKMIELTRDYTDTATFGQLVLECGSVFATVERPWLKNLRGISCIPEGVYQLRLRQSAVVDRTTRGEFTSGWQVMNVPGRDLIMLHVANFPTDVEGCIGIGTRRGLIYDRPAVLSSRYAFAQMMLRMAVRNEWALEIKRR